MSRLKVVGGKIVRPSEQLEKLRVSHVALAATGSLQMVSGFMFLKRSHTSGFPPRFEGPIRAAWQGVCTAYPDQTSDLTYVGALVAAPDGEFRGQIDWIKDTAQESTDGA